MPWPRRTRSEAELIRKIDHLSTRLLEVNATLRLKVLYCQKLELLLHQRNERVDTLYGQLQLAWQRNQKLDAEADHWARLFAANSGRANGAVRNEAPLDNFPPDGTRLNYARAP